jgi:hypothetical protein
LAPQRAWTGALEYVACLNSVNYLGHNDWRLPNVIEFRSLTHHGEEYNANWLTTQGFTNVWADFYWTSDTYPETAWRVSMYYGSQSSYGKKISNYYYVWPMRGNTRTSFMPWIPLLLLEDQRHDPKSRPLSWNRR